MMQSSMLSKVPFGDLLALATLPLDTDETARILTRLPQSYRSALLQPGLHRLTPAPIQHFLYPQTQRTLKPSFLPESSPLPKMKLSVHPEWQPPTSNLSLTPSQSCLIASPHIQSRFTPIPRAMTTSNPTQNEAVTNKLLRVAEIVAEEVIAHDVFHALVNKLFLKSVLPHDSNGWSFYSQHSDVDIYTKKCSDIHLSKGWLTDREFSVLFDFLSRFRSYSSKCASCATRLCRFNSSHQLG